MGREKKSKDSIWVVRTLTIRWEGREGGEPLNLPAVECDLKPPLLLLFPICLGDY